MSNGVKNKNDSPDPEASGASDPEEAPQGEQLVSINKTKLVLIRKLLENIKESNERLILLLSAFITPEEEAHISIGQLGDEAFRETGAESAEKIIEGIFDGEKMIGPDGKSYNIPANYASKSKLVEGDILKLSITASGTFIYKQIGPIERIRVVGELKSLGDNEYAVTSEGRSWRVLAASVTYFKGSHGDEAIILIPKTGESRWAAVENIIKK